MSGTKIGGQRAAKTNKERHGENFYKRIGQKGGLVCTPTGGFGCPWKGPDGLTGPERARLVGAKGGKKSTRLGVKTGEGKTAKKKKGLLGKIFGGE